ncbi:glycoside hydrolase family 88 protein [Lacticaseibacillus daqingensis]|uniref:glycoside hydrolase family 88 protein n=1 Tax=Lacticaseibacillus daqingensis TaxID=2486014 RepID=UPI000F77FC7E|nr:glycoside hydrolase family 88 protein [Lacticaseibacillus daqingensis]
MSQINLEPLKDPQRFLDQQVLSETEIDAAIAAVVAKVKHNIVKLGETFPSSSTVNNAYVTTKNVEWTTGFWTGILWLCYEVTGDDHFRHLAEKNVVSFKARIDQEIDVDHHDLGFLYSPSCVSAYKLTGNPVAKAAALEAADKLMTRYNPKGQFIQAWGAQGSADNYRLIVDAMLNIPLLFWASEETGDEKYRDVATKHYATTLKYAIRDDASAFHTFYFDPVTGAPLGGKTRQGYSDDSSWARGQAWLIYGIALNYTRLRDDSDLPTYEAVTNYFLNRVPADMVSYWDLIFGDQDWQSKDSSATAIAVCGMQQMQRFIAADDPLHDVYAHAAAGMLRSLIRNYTEAETTGITALLNHGVYSWHSGRGVDEGNLWGDYFFLEALVRYKKDWQMYW